MKITKEANGIVIAENVEVSTIKTTQYLFSALPASPTTGMLATITDASYVKYRSVARGGGSDVALVFYNGTHWVYH